MSVLKATKWGFIIFFGFFFLLVCACGDTEEKKKNREIVRQQKETALQQKEIAKKIEQKKCNREADLLANYLAGVGYKVADVSLSSMEHPVWIVEIKVSEWDVSSTYDLQQKGLKAIRTVAFWLQGNGYEKSLTTSGGVYVEIKCDITGDTGKKRTVTLGRASYDAFADAFRWLSAFD